MNKLRKIGVSALAGALVSFSASAAEWNLSGSAGITMSNADEGTAASSFSQDDNIVVSASGTTENGIDVAAMFKIENGTGGAYDEFNVSFGTDTLGTVTFHGHGGSPVMGQFDDITPKAYEEVWDIGGVDESSTSNDASTSRINGVGEQNNIFTYQSPSIQGLTFKAAYATANANAATSSGNDTKGSYSRYMDWGVQFSPEMVDGLTLYYAQGTTTAATVDTDESTIGLTYAYGPVTVGYQESESDVENSSNDDEVEQYSIAYAISDNLSVSYGEREYDHNTGTASGDGSETQKDSGFGVSYTMGGLSIGGSMNEHENNAGATKTSADFDSYEVTVSFAF